MSLNLTISNIQKAELFVSIFQHVKVFSESVNIMFEEERIFIQSMDSSRVSVFEITIPSIWFDKYELSKNINIGIHTVMFSSVLNTRDKTQQINFMYNADDDKLFIHFTRVFQEIKDMSVIIDDDDVLSVISESISHKIKTKSKGKKELVKEPDIETISVSANTPAPYVEFDRHFELSLIDIECELMAIPEIDYQAEFSISSIKFASIVNQLKIFGDTLDFKCTEENIIMYSVSKEQGKMFVEINIDDLSSYAIEEGETVNLSFSIKYLQNICLYSKITREIEIKLLKNYPLKIIYRLYEGAELTFYLAPKINEDDME